MRGRFAILLVLFVGSGCAALIYEIVWFQLLRLTIGASAVSLGIILATFMGGMCLGSLLFHRWISERHHPLAVYGWLELGVAAFGLLNLLLIPAIGGLYFEITGYGYGDILLRGAIAALFLLPLSEISYPEALFDLGPFSERALREYYDEIRTALQAAR